VESSLSKSGKGSGKGAGDDLSAYRKAPVVIRARTPDVHADSKVRGPRHDGAKNNCAALSLPA
jgi:hypothetical protein